MKYREYCPHILLTPYIEAYWTVSGFVEKEEHHKILPDGCVDIIFSLEETSHQSGLKSMFPNIVGTMTTYLEGSYLNNISLLGIRFKPAGFTAFTQIPIYEFTDQRIDLTSIESLFDEEFYYELPSKETAEKRIQEIDKYFLKRLKNIFKLDQQIVYAIELIRQTEGKLSLMTVASESCLSIRHFERRFKTAIGIAPKTFSKVVKFQHTLSYLKKNNHLSIISLAIDCGYYDQAHLIKDFKSLSGNPPSHFKL